MANLRITFKTDFTPGTITTFKIQGINKTSGNAYPDEPFMCQPGQTCNKHEDIEAGTTGKDTIKIRIHGENNAELDLKDFWLKVDDSPHNYTVYKTQKQWKIKFHKKRSKIQKDDPPETTSNVTVGDDGPGGRD